MIPKSVLPRPVLLALPIPWSTPPFSVPSTRAPVIHSCSPTYHAYNDSFYHPYLSPAMSFGQTTSHSDLMVLRKSVLKMLITKELLRILILIPRCRERIRPFDHGRWVVFLWEIRRKGLPTMSPPYLQPPFPL